MTSVAPPAAASMRPGRVLAALLVPLVSVAVYWPAIWAGFVGDDFMILHRLGGLTAPGDVLRFFGAEFFEYYRPIGFLAHAVDYGIAGEDARQFHLTNLLLHATNATLVLLIGQRLSPRSLAGPIAALLFALHASNHEAVVWISARFDLLATAFALGAIWWMVRREDSHVLPAFLFALAVLSKESAVALPLAAAGWSVFVLGSNTRGTILRVTPWLVALATGALLRQIGGGVSAVGGTARLPKLLALAAVLGLIVLLSDGRWIRLRDRLRARRAWAASGVAIGLLVAAVLAAGSSGAAGRFAAEKLAVAGFAIFHLLSPIVEVSDTPFYRDPSTTRSQVAGLALTALFAGIVLVLWRRLLDDPRMWFLGACLVATLLPISALTEGKRYLYLPSAVFSLAAGVLLAEVSRARRPLAFGAIGVVLAISVADISVRIRDWAWAGRMIAEGAALVDDALAPSCNAGHVVFLTSPVAVRGVYTHFYYETFELARGCRPDVFQVLVRAMRVDVSADVRWEEPDRISITVPRYPGTFVLSEDLRHFDRPLRRGASEMIDTPLGPLRAEPFGEEGLRLTLSLAEPLREQPPLFFYYSDGRIHRLQPS